MNSPKPKFDLFDYVKVRFDGEVAGEPVSVYKKLYVLGIDGHVSMGDHYSTGYYFLYRLSDTFVNSYRYTDVSEDRITKIEE